jgi:D-alanyl-D-alanine carboxypeptidase/D-alanyl-D-alanine-endopeptidase (penicillin-binding protein 4)
MKRIFALILFPWITLLLFSQQSSFENFIADSAMKHAEVSFCLIGSDSGNIVFEYNSGKSLVPASIMKIITSSAALELLGPDYTFRTLIGYTGTINKRSGKLDGDIIIRGGGDPALGSQNFKEHYGDFIENWITEIRKLGIRKINGRVITDDSYYDYLPIPAKWLWEDAGNYYGAGAYGLSVFDNTYEIHFRTTSDSSGQTITGIVPEECDFEFNNWLVAAGTADEGYVFAAPYSTNGWLAGTIPANLDDFVLKASIADPPRLMARIVNRKLETAGIQVSCEPSTTRLLQTIIKDEIHIITETTSPPLKEILEVLNHKSVNLYAEHLVKELGKKYRRKGSTEAGIEVVYDFLAATGVKNEGLFIEDGSGVSPLNAITSESVAEILLYMRNKGKYSDVFWNSLAEAGKEGTLNNYFKDPVFESSVRAKSGSMTRVRNYAGYLRTNSGKDMIFCIIVNNFMGPVRDIITGIEEILKENILNN